MQMLPVTKSRDPLALAAAAVLIWSMCAAMAHAQTTITDLGVLPSDTFSTALAVNADGTVVVGTCRRTGGFDRGYRWTASGGMQELGFLNNGRTLTPKGVSADGQVISGQAEDGAGGAQPTRAIRWTPSGGIQSLGLLSGSPSTIAEGISGNGGVIAGTAGSNIAFRHVGGTIQPISTLPSSTGASALAANFDGGVVVGWVGFLSGTRAFRWSAGGGMQDLGFLPGHTGSFARGVSSDGTVVVGYSYQTVQGGGSIQRPFRWTQGGGMQNLGTFPGGVNVYALGVSGDGTKVVGYDSDQMTIRPFLWTQETGLQNLNVLLPTLGVDLTGWTITNVTGISADGSAIIGNASHNGQSRGFIIKFSDACAADFNSDSVVDFFDYLDFVEAFSAGGENADFNNDSVVDFFDYLDFVAEFSVGC